MKINQILSLLFFLTCFSCDRTQAVDTKDVENKRKEDSLNRANFLAYSDSMEKMYASIKIPHTWNQVEKVNGKIKALKSKDTLHIHQRVHIDISTGYQVTLIWFFENEKWFNIKSISDEGDSVIFNTNENETNESTQWIFKYTDKEKTIGSWSIYNPDTKVQVLTGRYISEKNENE